MTVSTMLTTMAEGMVRTCGIFFLTLLFSLPLGMIIMLLRRSRITIVSEVMKVLLAIVRGTPLMLQLLVWYFGFRGDLPRRHRGHPGGTVRSGRGPRLQ